MDIIYDLIKADEIPALAVSEAEWTDVSLYSIATLFGHIRRSPLIAVAPDFFTLCAELAKSIAVDNAVDPDPNRVYGDSTVTISQFGIQYITNSGRTIAVAEQLNGKYAVKFTATENPSRIFFAVLKHYLGTPAQLKHPDSP